MEVVVSAVVVDLEGHTEYFWLFIKNSLTLWHLELRAKKVLTSPVALVVLILVLGISAKEARTLAIVVLVEDLALARKAQIAVTVDSDQVMGTNNLGMTNNEDVEIVVIIPKFKLCYTLFTRSNDLFQLQSNWTHVSRMPWTKEAKGRWYEWWRWWKRLFFLISLLIAFLITGPPTCFNCQEVGHMSRECTKPRQNSGRGRGGRGLFLLSDSFP